MSTEKQEMLKAISGEKKKRKRRKRYFCPDCPRNPRLGRIIYIDPHNKPWSAWYCDVCGTVFGRDTALTRRNKKNADTNRET